MVFSPDGELLEEYLSDWSGRRVSSSARTVALPRPARGAALPDRDGRPTGRPAEEAASSIDPGGDFSSPAARKMVSVIGDLAGAPVSAESADRIYRACVGHYVSKVAEVVAARRRSDERRKFQDRPSNVDAQEVRRVRRDFLDSSVPCFFPGCEDLRKARIEKIDQAGGPECKSCTRSSINGEFMALAVRAYSESKEGSGE